MAYLIDAWEMNGKADECVKTVRISKITDIPEIVNEMKKLPNVTIITKSRTDHQSPICHTVWKDDSYIDLNERT